MSRTRRPGRSTSLSRSSTGPLVARGGTRSSTRGSTTSTTGPRRTLTFWQFSILCSSVERQKMLFQRRPGCWNILLWHSRQPPKPVNNILREATPLRENFLTALAGYVRTVSTRLVYVPCAHKARTSCRRVSADEPHTTAAPVQRGRIIQPLNPQNICKCNPGPS